MPNKKELVTSENCPPIPLSRRLARLFCIVTVSCGSTLGMSVFISTASMMALAASFFCFFSADFRRNSPGIPNTSSEDSRGSFEVDGLSTSVPLSTGIAFASGFSSTVFHNERAAGSWEGISGAASSAVSCSLASSRPPSLSAPYK